MIWFIDEYFDKQIRALELCPGVDITLDAHDADEIYVTVSVFWHKPGLNLEWYPICQIDLNYRTIFRRDGSEAPEQWPEFMEQAADALEAALAKWSKT